MDGGIEWKEVSFYRIFDGNDGKKFRRLVFVEKFLIAIKNSIKIIR